MRPGERHSSHRENVHKDKCLQEGTTGWQLQDQEGGRKSLLSLHDVVPSSFHLLLKEERRVSFPPSTEGMWASQLQLQSPCSKSPASFSVNLQHAGSQHCPSAWCCYQGQAGGHLQSPLGWARWSQGQLPSPKDNENGGRGGDGKMAESQPD